MLEPSAEELLQQALEEQVLKEQSPKDKNSRNISSETEEESSPEDVTADSFLNRVENYASARERTTHDLQYGLVSHFHEQRYGTSNNGSINSREQLRSTLEQLAKQNNFELPDTNPDVTAKALIGYYGISDDFLEQYLSNSNRIDPETIIKYTQGIYERDIQQFATRISYELNPEERKKLIDKAINPNQIPKDKEIDYKHAITDEVFSQIAVNYALTKSQLPSEATKGLPIWVDKKKEGAEDD